METLEPFEEVIIEPPKEYSGTIIETLGKPKGDNERHEGPRQSSAHGLRDCRHAAFSAIAMLYHRYKG